MSGGLQSKGHPIAATGIANIWEVCHHLRGEAGDRQIEGAKVGLAHVIGLGSACGVHILEKSGRLRHVRRGLSPADRLVHITWVRPPSTTKISPLVYLLRSSASTASAQSSGVADRGIGSHRRDAGVHRRPSPAVHGVAHQSRAPRR